MLMGIIDDFREEKNVTLKHEAKHFLASLKQWQNNRAIQNKKVEGI